MQPGSGGSRLIRITAGDLVVIALILMVGLSLLVLRDPVRADGATVRVQTLRGERFVLDLSRDRTVMVEGLLGTTTISIEQGTVRFLDSPCPHRLCIGKGRISAVGEWIACLPNGVVARISGESAYDGITP